MLNTTGITTETATSPKQILFNVEHQMSVGVRVDATGVVADSDGKKILYAGTPMVGSLEARGTAFVKQSAEAVATGILLHDVDVTAGATNATLLIWGFVNLDRIDTTTAALLTTAVKGDLAKITFLKD